LDLFWAKLLTLSKLVNNKQVMYRKRMIEL
jgi:hypothetical protein